jgi:hypothetical protein
LLRPEDPPGSKRGDADFIAAGENRRGEHHPDCRPEQAPPDLGVVVVLHDITNFRKLERMRADFVANVFPRMKTPVDVVEGICGDIIGRGSGRPETAREFVRIIL